MIALRGEHNTAVLGELPQRLLDAVAPATASVIDRIGMSRGGRGGPSRTTA